MLWDESRPEVQRKVDVVEELVLLLAADLRRDDAALDAIDDLVAISRLADEDDRGFSLWWFEPRARGR